MADRKWQNSRNRKSTEKSSKVEQIKCNRAEGKCTTENESCKSERYRRNTVGEGPGGDNTESREIFHTDHPSEQIRSPDICAVVLHMVSIIKQKLEPNVHRITTWTSDRISNFLNRCKLIKK